MRKKSKQAQFARLKAFIDKEIRNLDRLMQEAEHTSFDTAHPRHIGSLLHDFYTGIERVFERIATNLDGEVPSGETWHKDLLDSMALELEGIRPPFISEYIQKRLDEYLRFRHLFRSLYGFELDKERMRKLYERMGSLYEDFKKETVDFKKFLDKLSEQI